MCTIFSPCCPQPCVSGENKCVQTYTHGCHNVWVSDVQRVSRTLRHLKAGVLQPQHALTWQERPQDRGWHCKTHTRKRVGRTHRNTPRQVCWTSGHSLPMCLAPKTHTRTRVPHPRHGPRQSSPPPRQCRDAGVQDAYLGCTGRGAGVAGQLLQDTDAVLAPQMSQFGQLMDSVAGDELSSAMRKAISPTE